MISHRKTVNILLFGCLAVTLQVSAAPQGVSLPKMHGQGYVIRDTDGIAHIFAKDEHDMAMLQGWVHAEDRLFQMDVLRRSASGRLAELLGPEALSSDVEMRTLGLHRAATRSLAALSSETAAALQAYADGVNAWVARNSLPPDYAPLELTTFETWNVHDSVAVGKLLAAELSLRLDIDATIQFLTYQATGSALGFDGEALYFEDVERVAPLAGLATMPDATGGVTPYIQLPIATASRRGETQAFRRYRQKSSLSMAKRYRNRVQAIPFFQGKLRDEHAAGSNEFVVSGRLSVGARPLFANDPHLRLTTPTTLYPNHLVSGDGIDVQGYSIAGAPYVILGQNNYIVWGGTVSPVDVTDVFEEQIVPEPSSPSGLASVYLGEFEPVIPIAETFRFNRVGDGLPDNFDEAPPGGSLHGVNIPAATLVVPRRNQGPIIQLDREVGSALSVQYAGFSATREIDALRLFSRARNVDDFRDALKYLDVGSLNFAYADIHGDIAFFVGGEIPVREDLQLNTVAGAPPWFIRDGTGGNEWAPVTNRQPGQALQYEVLPQAELPGFVNPVRGYFVNANNDSAGVSLDNDPLNQLRLGGTGLYYIGARFFTGSRAYRITTRIEDRLRHRRISARELERIQADVRLHDAQIFVPHIINAFDNATRPDAPAKLRDLAAIPRVVEAMERLRHWQYSSPTGVREGYDASDLNGRRARPSRKEIEESIATTIYSVWRSRFIANTIDASLSALQLGDQLPSDTGSVKALRQLLENFDATQGVGASGVNFFSVADVAIAADRRDILILGSLDEALGELAGPSFAAAFGQSTEQNDYRWGRLHRIVFASLLGEPFSTPPAGGAIEPSFPDLPGLATDGAYNVVDQSPVSARAANDASFMFNIGPNFRYVGRMGKRPGSIRARSSLPGGTSGMLGSRFYANLLKAWLTNDTYRVRHSLASILAAKFQVTHFMPQRPVENKR